MKDGSLRRVLMSETRDLHDRLDQAIGVFADAGAYRGFLTGSYRFRAALEPRLTDGAWQVQRLSRLLEQDMADLDQPRPALPAAPALEGARRRRPPAMSWKVPPWGRGCWRGARRTRALPPASARVTWPRRRPNRIVGGGSWTGWNTQMFPSPRP
ncbi:hypothetical protein ACFSYD_01325 [Paracoccus aerius]